MIPVHKDPRENRESKVRPVLRVRRVQPVLQVQPEQQALMESQSSGSEASKLILRILQD